MSHLTQTIVDNDFVSISLSPTPSSSSDPFVHISPSEPDDHEFVEITSDDVPLALNQDQRKALQIRYSNEVERAAYISLHNHKIRLCCSTKPLDQRLFKAVETVLKSLDKRTKEIKKLRLDNQDLMELVKGLHGEMGDLQKILTDGAERLDEKEREVDMLKRELNEKSVEVEEKERELSYTREELRKRNVEVGKVRERLREKEGEVVEVKEELEKKMEELKISPEMQEEKSEEAFWEANEC